MRALFLATLLLFTCGMAAAMQTQTPPPAQQTDGHPKFPPGEGRELTIQVCGECHEAEQAADLQLDRAGWKDLVNQMASKGTDATEAQLEIVTNYLATAFPPPPKQ